MDVLSENQHFTSYSFLFTLDAGATFLSGKHPKHQSETLSKVLFFISGNTRKKGEQIDELSEKADNLLLENQQVESIAETAISTGALDADVAN